MQRTLMLVQELITKQKALDFKPVVPASFVSKVPKATLTAFCVSACFVNKRAGGGGVGEEKANRRVIFWGMLEE